MYCPIWIFDISVSQVACEFVSGDMGLEAFAGKYAAGLSERYDTITVEELSAPAEELLQFLAEIEAGDMAVDLIRDYAYYRLYNDGTNKPRKMKPMFGSIEDGIKTKGYSSEGALKSFRAYVFGLRSNTVKGAPAGWTLADDEHLEAFGALVAKKLSILDVL